MSICTNNKILIIIIVQIKRNSSETKKKVKTAATMMHTGNEWYWNLNLHRNQSALSNPMAVNSTKLPISSAMYTSAVLTDRGICVGMRNVNLKGVTQSYSAKMQNIPNCCSNSSVVGQRNKQTWTAAYDQMRFSALTDPSMATNIECQPHFTDLPPQISDKRGEQVMLPEEEEAKLEEDLEEEDEETVDVVNTVNDNFSSSLTNTSSSISAELNPFHLFGDKSILSAINVKNRLSPEYLQHFTGANVQEHLKSEITTPPIKHVPYLDYRYLIANDTTYNRIGYPGFLHAMTNKKPIPLSPSISPISHLPCNSGSSNSSRLKAAMTTPRRRMHTNASRLNHVVAPKKKWIRNYMQSNSHFMVFFEYYFQFFSFFHFIFRFYHFSLCFFFLFSVLFHTDVNSILWLFFLNQKRMWAFALDMCRTS